jgi:hypothetical protein
MAMAKGYIYIYIHVYIYTGMEENISALQESVCLSLAD